MPLESLLAALEEAGYRRHRARRLSRNYISRVVFHKRDKDGRLVFPGRNAGRPGGPVDTEETWRLQMFRMGLPEWFMARKVAELRAQMERAMGGRAASPGR